MTRRGFTLAELLVVAVIGGGAAGFMISTLLRQQRFYSSAAAILDLRGELRDATEVIAGDLRGAAAGAFGLPVMTDSAVEMYATVASSVICGVTSATSFSIPPIPRESGNALTSMLVQPDTGDIAFIYGIPEAQPDSGYWHSAPIAGFASSPVSVSCPESTGFTTLEDASAGARGFVVTLAGDPAYPPRTGAPIHFLRRARYSIYKSSDGKWYLGYRRCSAGSGCSSIQPVSGPYEAYSPSAPAGIAFRYYDAEGEQLMPGSVSDRVARIEIVVRGRAAGASSLYGDSRVTYRDSAVVTVGMRNRW